MTHLLPPDPLGDENLTVESDADTLLVMLHDDKGNPWEKTFHTPLPPTFLQELVSSQPLRFTYRSSDPLMIALGDTFAPLTYLRNATRIPIDNDQYHGLAFLPDTPTSDTAVLLLSGGGGGLCEGRGALYASRGIPAFSLAYILHEGLPDTIEDIPLEYFERAIAYITKTYQIKKLAILGSSRGGELALLLASYFPDLFTGVVAIVPTSVTYGGMPNLAKPAWTYKGKGLPIAPFPPREVVERTLKPDEPITLAPLFENGFTNFSLYADALIPVQNITCPLMLISAGKDKVWPSKRFCEQILKQKPNAMHLCYEDAGHAFSLPNHPTTSSLSHQPIEGLILENGGTKEAQAEANTNCWHQILTFLTSL